MHWDKVSSPGLFHRMLGRGLLNQASHIWHCLRVTAQRGCRFQCTAALIVEPQRPNKSRRGMLAVCRRQITIPHLPTTMLMENFWIILSVVLKLSTVIDTTLQAVGINEMSAARKRKLERLRCDKATPQCDCEARAAPSHYLRVWCLNPRAVRCSSGL